MSYGPYFKLNKISSHRKERSTGVYLKVLSEDYKQKCIALDDAMRLFAIVTYTIRCRR